MSKEFKIFIILVLFSFIRADEPIAIVSKLRGSVKHKMATEEKFKTKVNVHTAIFDRGQVRSGGKSFAKVVYLDDGSAVAVYPETELTISGTIENRIIEKHIGLKNGILQLDIKLQTGGKFTLSTPHSELDCQECKFWVISNEETGDQFYLEDGYSHIKSPSLDAEVTLVRDSTTVSVTDQKLENNFTQVTELKFLEMLMLDAEEKVHEEKKAIDEVTTGKNETPKSHEVVIKLINAAKVERKLILTYTQ